MCIRDRSVTTITNKCRQICTKFYAKFTRGKGRPSSCFVTIGESNGQKLRKPAIVYKIAPSGNSELAGSKIVGVASVAKCWQQKRFRGDLFSFRVLSI